MCRSSIRTRRTTSWRSTTLIRHARSELTPLDGVDRIVEVDFSDNVDLDASVVKQGAVIATYGTRDERPSLPFWPMLFENVTLRLLGSDDFPSGREAASSRRSERRS